MAREQGTFNFSANFEVSKEGTLDARQSVDNFSDLLTFTSENFIPQAFFVSVKGINNPSELGLYLCVDKDNLNLAASWEKVGRGEETPASAITIDNSGLVVVPATNLQTYLELNDIALLKARGTEVLGGTGAVSFTPGTTTFNVGITIGQIKDVTGYYPISYAGGTNFEITTTGATNTWVYIDKANTVQQQTTEPTRTEFRQKLFLTRLALVNGVLTAQAEECNPSGQYTNMLRDYLSYVKKPKKGLELTPNPNLTFQVSAGGIFEIGAQNAENEDDPNEITFPLQNPATFFFVNRSIILGVGLTSVDVTEYDFNNVQTPLVNNRFKILTVHKFNSGNHIIQDGQNQYSTIDEAINGISNRNFVVNPILSTGTRLGWIIVQEGATNLQEITTARLINDKGDVATAISSVGNLLVTNNLSDLENVITAKINLGLDLVDNTSDANKPISTATQTALDLKLETSLKGSVNGLAELDENGFVPNAQLPSYVDDVLEFTDFVSFPLTGETSKIYIALDTNLTYRWGGTAYTEISKSLALGETTGTAYRGDRGKIAYDHSLIISGNPHNVTKTEVGLDQVDNTSDINKPVSSAQATAIGLAESNANTYTDNKIIGVPELNPALKSTITTTSSANINIDWNLSIKNVIDLGVDTIITFTNFTTYEEVKVHCIELTFVGNVSRIITWPAGVDLSTLAFNPIEPTKRNFLNLRYLGDSKFQIENYKIDKI